MDLDVLQELNSIYQNHLAGSERNEEALNNLYHKCIVEILRKQIKKSSISPCSVSQLQFPKDQLDRACNFQPIRTTGNGNCLFNACSLALIGNESLSIFLRCLTSAELFLHSEFYANHPLLIDRNINDRHINENHVLSIFASNAAWNVFEKSKKRNCVVDAEAINVAKNFVFSSFLCVLALASVIGLKIEAYYPKNDDRQEKSEDIYEMLFNSTVLPRQNLSITDEKIHIFFCCSAGVDFLSAAKFSNKKNHFVPLLPISMEGLKFSLPQAFLQHKRLSQVLPSRSTKAVSSSSGNTCLSTMSVSEQSSLHVRKRYQSTTLDHFITKKSLGAAEKNILVEKKELQCKIEKVSVPGYDSSTENLADNNALSGSAVTVSSPLSTPCNNFDIGLFYNQKSIPDDIKYSLLTNSRNIDPKFQFPANSSGRKFQLRWLSEFPWLSYSTLLDGAFCLYCVIFGVPEERSYGVHKLDQLFKSPYSSWSKALQKFRNHAEKSNMHRSATLRATHFRQYMERKTNPIDLQLSKITDEQVRQNREKLKPIVGAVILCGRQTIALRGHRDDSQYDFDDNNAGNLQAILRYLQEHGNNNQFEYHMLNASKRATYRSKTTQNELIKICGDMIVSRLSEEIIDAKFFSVLADEAADISRIEQMPLVIRFVDASASIREEFLGFVACLEGLSGEAMSRTITQAVEQSGLSMQFCRGQGYDGAGNLAGKCSGAAARIQREYPKASYVHCGSHALNLCVASACGLQEVKNMMGHVRVVSQFFNSSPKRFDLLCKMIKEICPEARHCHLLDVCRTRWLARIDGLDVFVEVFVAIVASLEKVMSNEGRKWNPDSVRDANSLFHATIDFQFIVILVIVSRCLEVTRPLTKQLQSSTFEVVAAHEKITLLFASLKRLRVDKETFHKSWFDEAVTLAQSVDVSPSKPRTVRRQMHRSNVPADTPLQYYERSITLPFLDHLIVQMQTRFSQRYLTVMNGFSGMPSEVLTNKDWKEQFHLFLDFCGDDLPEPRYLKTELNMWEDHWRASSATPTTLSSLLPQIDKITFPNILVAFKVLGTVPVTTCTCERSISVLRRLKTYLRNTMTQNRLNGLALLSVHREIKLETEDIIDIFARKHPRRMRLVDVWNTDPEESFIDKD